MDVSDERPQGDTADDRVILDRKINYAQRLLQRLKTEI